MAGSSGGHKFSPQKTEKRMVEIKPKEEQRLVTFTPMQKMKATKTEPKRAVQTSPSASVKKAFEDALAKKKRKEKW